VGLKEFNPDKLFLLGPSNSLGGVLGQILTKSNWKNISNKETFHEYQNETSFLNSMGIS